MITREEILKLAELARLKLDNEEIVALQEDLGKMLDYVQSLKEVDTSGVEPGMPRQEERNVLREDVVGESLPVEEALRNAPERSGAFFKVPPVITVRMKREKSAKPTTKESGS